MEEIRACGVLEPKVSAFHSTSSSSSVKLGALYGRLLLLWTSHILTCTSNYLSSVAIIPFRLFNSYFQSFLALETFKWFVSFAGSFFHDPVTITFRGLKPCFHTFSLEEALLIVALAKSGPLDFPSEENFPLIFCPWKGFRTHVSKIVKS